MEFFNWILIEVRRIYLNLKRQEGENSVWKRSWCEKIMFKEIFEINLSEWDVRSLQFSIYNFTISVPVFVVNADNLIISLFKNQHDIQIEKEI